MNLLIEQRSTTITSKLQQQQSQLSNENDVNNSLSSSPLILKIKRQSAKQQIDFSSTPLLMTNDDNNNNNSRLNMNNQRLKRSIPNSTTRRPSSPAFNGKQQVTKRSITIDNNNNDLPTHIDDISSTKRFKHDDLNSSSTKVDASVETVSIGLATEPDQLGPCEPGTSVVLEGIVWNETDSGVLVVNVTWRGKTYVGTLLDSTQQDWACPRLICESPTSDYDARNSSKTSRAKRASAGGNNRCISNQLTNSSQQILSTTLSSGSDDRKLRNNIKSRQSKRTNLNIIDEIATTPQNSSPLTSPFPSTTTFFPSSTTAESQLISCPELQCHKKFVSTIALNYHLSNSHKKTDSNLSLSIQQPTNTRDEEDVAHILANVADYVRRPSPRSSPEHQHQTTLSWPCPQISSNLVLSSPLINNEQTTIPLSTNPTRCILNNNEGNIEHDEVKPADHFLLHIQDEPSSSSWNNSKLDHINDNKKTLKIPSPPPSFVSINLTSSIQPPPPPTSSSPAYSDISDEDTTIMNENEQISPPSTINLLTATNGKMDENDQSIVPNNSWTAQMLLQQYGSFMQQQTSNRLNSKTNSNGTSDSTVKNILDSRRLSTTKSSSSSSSTNDSNDYQKPLYHYHPNDSKSMMNSLTLPNENLLKPSSTTATTSIINPLDYSLNNTITSSSIHPSR
ncbi:unnamed protein product [Adineta steineri]|uniref:C2H2-type domain-containing protein n=1 Tax=Adineta steineri TaxID=433720 RepID=A0A818Z8D3_9BILA|nr:unnamed protein product [Adineta steineri]CAF3764897.1 unnamed protein product [Adineta steineri]